jgi:hypothetical protein
MVAAAWMQELDSATASVLSDHLDGCALCAAEMAELGAMWNRLGDLPVPEPSLAMRARWEQTLESLSLIGAVTPTKAPKRAWWQNFWPANPAWQMAVAALCLAVGLGGGVLLQRGHGERDEVARLREEVASTKEMVALSLLQQQSAAERLRGVDYSARMPSLEPQVIAALVEAVNRDTNVNVRLAAIDALGKVAGDTQVRASLQQALVHQDSPMVQAALIDYLVDARDRNAVGVMQDLVARPNVNPTVRDRANFAVRQLAQ